MIKQTLDEWRAEARERFGDNGANWKFICPRCGNVQSPQDFIDTSCSSGEVTYSAYQECIGRKIEERGCDWASFGLLGTMGKGRIVVTPDGQEVEVFDFAPVSEGTSMTCIGCGKHPNEIDEYVEAAAENDMTPTQYVIEEEGTYDRFEPKRFYCTSCYIKAGMPVFREGSA
ncbi:VVA0879 family protein [Paenibacillus timonensis]|uniref:VVA0879 family protein n=1 Tax=Paenibacillus timonensis TaxID=225915 RepID=UPI003F947A57